jgi:hypothetical protein
VWWGRGGIDQCGGVPSSSREEAARNVEEATVGCSEEIAVGHVEDSDAKELDGGRRGDLGLH